MIVIIEGPNRVGKSTQIANLKNFYECKGMRVHVIHYEHIHLDPEKVYKPDNMKDMAFVRYDDMLHLADEFAKDPQTVIIFDRAHLGETVYGPKFRNYSGDYVYDLELKYKDFLQNAYEFVFVDSPEHLLSREDGLSPTQGLEDKKYEVGAFMDAFCKSNVVHKALIDIRDKDAEAVWKTIKEMIA